MNLDEHVKKYAALHQWFTTPQGVRAAQAFTEELGMFHAQLRGDRLLQLGQCGQNIWLPILQYYQKIILSPDDWQKGSSVITRFNQLPFDRDSIDCIIAPFTFEAFSRIKNPMDELDRILKPMGYIVFWGINPLSLWGLALKLGFLPMMGEGKVSLTSVFSVKHATLTRGYRQCVLNTFYYIPPTQDEKRIHAISFLNEMGKMLWLYPAGFYCLVVQKHEVIPLSLTLKTVEENYLGLVDNSLA